MTKKTITLVASLLLTAVAIHAQRQIDLRLNTASIHTSEHILFVNIEVRSAEAGQLNLAGQNYRLYYNAQSLELMENGAKSVLPLGKYSSLKIVENEEGISADGINQLSFDDNLGFVNLAIDLKDNENGGIWITNDQWYKIATLSFRIKETKENYEMVWGRDEISDQYATAYVQVSEWVQPYETSALVVDVFEDLEVKSIYAHHLDTPQISVGPNPAVEFVQVELHKPLFEDARVVLRDISGRALKNELIKKGQTSVKMNLGELLSTNYIVEVYTDVQGSLHHEKIVVAK